MSRLVVQILCVAVFMFLNVQSAAGMDSESIECLSCHDGGAAADVTLEVCMLFGCDHPLGVDYVILSATNRGLRSLAALPASIKLKGNSIGCGTCHVPYQDSDHAVLSSLRKLFPEIADPMLVMDNRKSELCLGCHIK